MGVPNKNRKTNISKALHLKGILERAGLNIKMESANSGTQYLHLLNHGTTVRISDHSTCRGEAFDVCPERQTIEEVRMEIFLRYKLDPPAWMGRVSWGRLNSLKWAQVKNIQIKTNCISLLGDQPIRRAKKKVKPPVEIQPIRDADPKKSQEENMNFEINTSMEGLI